MSFEYPGPISETWSRIREATLCKLGRHRPGHTKFNGGNPVVLCWDCHTIVRYLR